MPTFHFVQHKNSAESQEYEVKIEPHETGYRITIGDRIYDVDSPKVDAGSIAFAIGGQHHQAFGARQKQAQHSRLVNEVDLSRIWLWGRVWEIERKDQRRLDRRANLQAESGALAASMPSQILTVDVHVGDEVGRGDTLITLEAMKMETKLTAPYTGIVKSVDCQVGDVVTKGQILVIVESKAN